MTATVVFVHHFGGNQKATLKHQRLMQELGYGTRAFDLPRAEIPSWRGRRPKNLRWDISATVDAWAGELERALDAVPGPKIVFTFSFPSVALPALLARGARADVRGWICDGGPFLDTLRSQFALLAWSGETGWRKTALALAMYVLMGGPRYRARARRWMRRLPIDLPILSLRAEKDRLVPPRNIARFFALSPGARPEVEILPGLGHLEGLKKSPGAYRARIHKFCLSLDLDPGRGA